MRAVVLASLVKSRLLHRTTKLGVVRGKHIKEDVYKVVKSMGPEQDALLTSPRNPGADPDTLLRIKNYTSLPGITFMKVSLWNVVSGTLRTTNAEA